ncbi:mCG140316, partial [Mus musculus]
ASGLGARSLPWLCAPAENGASASPGAQRAELRTARAPAATGRPAVAPAPCGDFRARAPLCPNPRAAAEAGSEPASWATEAATVRAPAPWRCRTRSPCRNSWLRPLRTTRRPRPLPSPRARPSARIPWRPSRR